ncbi:NAD-dependent malic enzyme [Rhodobacteraceae bacterium B1Z28]|uniref:NAD-dependent malic enzyme n=1 Tax=Ruegeria haliotis TaxID=2747601 RepID=A0ABX2PY32_9RHOB|nr:NAD-dependent malic enzyme [Ruegeria haliotis]NVO58221.1 NAD-dependent malic enzyme [Ruegeria haliotis]
MVYSGPANLHYVTNPLLNKGTAFSLQEREQLGLMGLLPPHIETLETQLDRAYAAFEREETPLDKHVYLRGLQDDNEVLFYALLVRHLSEMMPIIYTPVVGDACKQFSEIYDHPRGLIIPFPERDRIDEMLDNAILPSVEAIVVTDGERILGLGDQGAGGMGIPIGKLSLYTAAGGINPSVTLPVVLDAGTNNQERLEDPLYIGWRHERISGDEYFEFVDLFVQAVMRKWPDVLLQFEDFAQQHAAPLLARYRDQLCTFNDDIQGTAAVTAGTLLAASNVTGVSLKDATIAFLGAGSAGVGIAEQLVQLMVRQGLSETEARGRIYLVDRNGLLTDAMTDLLPFQKQLVQPVDKVAGWAEGNISLLDVINNAKPNILVGVSGQAGLFSEAIIRAMADHTEHPVVLPLSNPTSRIEAVPADILRWSDGCALVATGSPFDPVTIAGNIHHIAQCNNSYIFPGMGLGVLAAGARRVTDGMFMAAAEALAALSPAKSDRTASLLPDVSDICEVSKAIAFAVGQQAQLDGVAPNTTEYDLKAAIDAKFWTPHYEEIA